MAEFMKFRSSLGGFNRQDVSDYIEKLCLEHDEKLRACEEENSALRLELAEVKSGRDALAAKVDRLHELFGELEATFRTIKEEKNDENEQDAF